MAIGFNNRRETPHTLLYNKKKIASAVVVAVVILVINIVSLVIDPVLIISKYLARVEYGSFWYEALTEEYAGLHIATYLFNVSNAERFQAGLDYKLKLEEVGPFTYQEYRVNDQLELDSTANVIRYSPRITPHFLPEHSVAYPEDINVTMPNLAMLSMASKVGTYSFLPRMGFNLLTSRLKSRAIVSMRASDYLWGYEESLIKLGHDMIPGFVKFDILGILDRLYDKKERYLFEVSANEEDKLAIKTVNGIKGLDKWGYNNPGKRTVCNSFINTYEGIGYPAEMTGNRTIRIYRTVLCRILEMDYHGTIMTPYGVESLEYKISNRTYQKNEHTECLCNAGNCIEGVSDLSPCFLGLPVVLSHAHFLNADPKLYERIEGIKPDEKRHGSSFVIEPKVSMVLDTKFTIQVNLLVRDARFNSETSAFSDMLIPVVYFNITQPPLLPKYHNRLYLMHFTGPRLLLAIQIFLAVLTVGLLVYAAILFGNKPKAASHSERISNVIEPMVKGQVIKVNYNKLLSTKYTYESSERPSPHK